MWFLVISQNRNKSAWFLFKTSPEGSRLPAKILGTLAAKIPPCCRVQNISSYTSSQHPGIQLIKATPVNFSLLFFQSTNLHNPPYLFHFKLVYYHGGWVVEVIIQYKANSFCLNLPTGTELGNITGYLESLPPNQLPQGVAIFELASAFSDFYPILKFFLQLTPNWP